jgi:hypothetical protein
MKLATMYGTGGRKALITLIAASALAACGGGGGDEPAAAAISTATTAPPTLPGGTSPDGTPTVAFTPPTTTPETATTSTPPPVDTTTPTPSDATTPPPADTTPPEDTQLQISGAPKTQAKVDEKYSFIPATNVADGNTLYFSVANLPEWLSFDSASGELSGTPTAAQTGLYSRVTIQVAADEDYQTLEPFDIEVVSTGSKSVMLSWVAPTQNEDGSVLSDLAGYRVRYGEAPGAYTTVISITNPGLVSYYVDGLVPGAYYFVVTSLNSQGVESNYSIEAFKAV